MESLRHDEWVGTTYGNGWMHRWLIRFLRVADVRLIYAFAAVFVIPPTLLINAKARNAIYRYFRRIHGYGPLRSAWMTLRNHCAFMEVVTDRFAMYAGKRFEITTDNYETFRALAHGEKGFVQLSSHIGNYELAGYSLAVEGKRMNALVFGGEKGSVMANRSRLFRRNNIRMIPMAEDMSHLFLADSALAAGEILSMPADRVFGSRKTYEVEILGHKADLPQGPFVLAAVRGLPVLFVAVMKTAARRYHISICRIDGNLCGSGKEKGHELARRYARQLTLTLERHPEQWYNFYDFWKKE